MKQSSSSQPWLLRPGVNFFRHLLFRSKAALISFSFLVPIAVLTWSFVATKQDAIATAIKEKDGLIYANEIVPAVKLARQYRRFTMQEQSTGVTPSELADTKAKFDAQILKIRQLDLIYGTNFKTTELLKKTDEAYLAAMPASAGLFKVFASHSKFNHAIGSLLSAVADGSGLTLDPEIDTYYLMDAGVNSLPSILEATAKMRVLAVSVVRSGKDVEIAGQELSQEEGLIDYLEDSIIGALSKVVAEHPEYKDDLNITEIINDIKKLRDMASDDLSKGGPERAAQIEAQGGKVVNGLENLQKLALSHLDQLLETRISTLKHDLYLIISIVIFFLATAAYMFLSFYRAMDSGLYHVQNTLQLMSRGDLTMHISPKGGDEITKLMQGMLEMQAALTGMIGVMREGAHQVQSNSVEVAQGATDMADRTTQTLQRLQDTASAMVQISATVQSTADNAHEATQLAKGNAQLAMRGGEVIAQMANTMDEIRGSSQKIGDIISVIDGIAFQTNILALNAAVEAARAGESGRGFAVVATEVRALAHRSAEAAKEIKSLINISVEKVESGNIITKNAAETMDKIVLSADSINQLLSDISISAREQSTGVKEVEHSVQELDNFTQANAALVEETAALAETLRGLSNDLVDEVSHFRVN